MTSRFLKRILEQAHIFLFEKTSLVTSASIYFSAANSSGDFQDSWLLSIKGSLFLQCVMLVNLIREGRRYISIGFTVLSPFLEKDSEKRRLWWTTGPVKDGDYFLLIPNAKAGVLFLDNIFARPIEPGY